MFMFHQHALKTGVVAATVLGIAFTACNKDDSPPPVPEPRNITFKLRGTGTDAARETGAVTITENTDSSINVILMLGKNKKDTVHQVYFIGGTYLVPTTDTLKAVDAKGNGGLLAVELFKNVKKVTLKQAAGATKEIPFRYNDAVKYVAHLKVKHSRFSTDTLTIGNVGKAN
ncbi:hypothetical protein SAMN04488128_102970 [Chitinophaga eiseniae]|uniref:Uncharacterized protein n=1 Tax=Chitinophaga eiseniae TaxID=634771 RepID=A0A1T4R9M6_9BACT|nr:hypothetical protein [Chitinophaga eiseniae]SKA12770.1 hypothetical protein SAMN04488128_102970 [Chitinophaga eiseniae]